MPNKYNIRAKRQELDNLVRNRAWTTVLTRFSDLVASVDDDDDGNDDDNATLQSIDAHGTTATTTVGNVKNNSDSHGIIAANASAAASCHQEPNSPSEQSPSTSTVVSPDSTNSEFIQAIIECNTRQTTHKTLLHSLCDISNYSTISNNNHNNSSTSLEDNAQIIMASIIQLVAPFSPSSLFIQDSGHGNHNRTPLHLAIARGMGLDVIRVLIRVAATSGSGANNFTGTANAIDTPPEYSKPPLQKSRKSQPKQDQTTHVKKQTKQRSHARLRKTPSSTAQSKNNHTLQHHQSSLQTLLLTMDSKGLTPLLLAAKMDDDHCNYDEVVKYLVNADFNCHEDRTGSTIIGSGDDGDGDFTSYSYGSSLLCSVGSRNTTTRRKGSEKHGTTTKQINQPQDFNNKNINNASEKKTQKQQQGGVPLKYVASRESLVVGQGLDCTTTSGEDDLLKFMIVKTYLAKMLSMFPTYYYSNYYCKQNWDITNKQIKFGADAIIPSDEKAEHNDGMITDAKYDESNNGVCLLQATIICYSLFGSAKIASSVLSSIIRNKLFHRAKLTHERDCMGNLTLHIACLSDGITKFDQILRLGDRISDYGLNGEDCTLMEYLVKNSSLGATADTAAAGITSSTSAVSVSSATTATTATSTVPLLCRNFEGDIPLHCAIKTYKEWDHIQLLIDAAPTSIRTCTSKGELPLHLAIKVGASSTYIRNVWSYHPEAASMIDASVGLYPFQMLALVFGAGETDYGNRSWSFSGNRARRKVWSKDGKGSGDWDPTSLSFFFLREYPDVVSSFLRDAYRQKS